MPRKTQLGQPKHRSLTLAESRRQAQAIVAAHGISMPLIRRPSTPFAVNLNTRRRRNPAPTLGPLAPLASNPEILHYASNAMNTKPPLPGIPRGKKGGIRSRRVSKRNYRRTFRR